MKEWITQEIIKSIKHMDKIKEKRNCDRNDIELKETYKNYRNYLHKSNKYTMPRTRRNIY